VSLENTQHLVLATDTVARAGDESPSKVVALSTNDSWHPRSTPARGLEVHGALANLLSSRWDVTAWIHVTSCAYRLVGDLEPLLASLDARSRARLPTIKGRTRESVNYGS